MISVERLSIFRSSSLVHKKASEPFRGAQHGIERRVDQSSTQRTALWRCHRFGIPSSRLEATSNIAYFRFHGQNSPKWEAAARRDQRYDYEYTEEQLQEWVEPITNLSMYVEETYVFFNNRYRGKAAKNAQMLQEH